MIIIDKHIFFPDYIKLGL